MEAMVMTQPKLPYTDPMWDDVPSTLNSEEVAELLRVHIQTVKRLLKNGVIPATKIGRAYRVNKLDLMRYMGLIEETVE
jgi:excisionase family DNA binding protein